MAETEKTEETPKAEEKAKPEKKAKGEKAGKEAVAGKPKASEKKGKGKEGQRGEQPSAAGVPKGYVPRLLKKYREVVVPAMQKKFSYSSPMQVPRIEKIVVNMGVGEATRNIKILDEAVEEMQIITGQKPKITRAAVSVSQFKVRQGMPVGCCVTLRRRRMYDFLDRLINVAIPRVRDFRGLPESAFDGRGNHSLGIREQLIFMEIDYNKVTETRGMNVTTVTTAKTDEECKELLRLFGMPFRRK